MGAMLHLSVGRHLVSLREFESRRAMMAITGTEEPLAVIGEEENDGKEFFGLSTESALGSGGGRLGICCAGGGFHPIFLAVPEEDEIWIAFNFEIVAVSLPGARIRFRTGLGWGAYGMWLLSDGSVLICLEIGVARVAPSGSVLWQFSTDIVEDFGFGGGRCRIRDCTGTTYLVDLGSGSLIEKQVPPRPAPTRRSGARRRGRPPSGELGPGGTAGTTPQT
jgi:hypothetical protein